MFRFSLDKKEHYFLFLALLFMFVSPLLLDGFWPFSYEEKLWLYSREIEFPSYLEQNLKQKTKLDFLILGSSMAGRDLDGGLLEQAFSQQRRRPAHGEIAVFNCGCLGEYYEYLSRLLKVRAVDVLFLQTSRGNDDLDSILMYDMPRDYEKWKDFPWSFQVRLWAMYLLSGPQRVLAHFHRDWNLQNAPTQQRKDDLSITKANAGAILRKLSFPDSSGKFKQQDYPVRNVVQIDELLSQGGGDVRFQVWRDFDPMEREFYLKIIRLAQEHKIRVYGLALPSKPPLGRERLRESEVFPWKGMAGEVQIRTVGVSEQRLLEQVSPSEEENIFYNEAHLNLNGARMLTHLMSQVMPEL